jgi:hypothetical protein
MPAHYFALLTEMPQSCNIKLYFAPLVGAWIEIIALSCLDSEAVPSWTRFLRYGSGSVVTPPSFSVRVDVVTHTGGLLSGKLLYHLSPALLSRWMHILLWMCIDTPSHVVVILPSPQRNVIFLAIIFLPLCPAKPGLLF